MIIQKLKAVFIFILNLIKRSLCCLRRRRKSSADVVPLTGVGVVPNFRNQGDSTGDEMVNWNNWEDPSKPKAPQTVEEHIQYYRNQRMGKQVEATTPEEPQVDFFQDMTPKIKKQTKLVMRPKDSSQQNRLAFNPISETALIPDDAGELKSWEENENRDGYWGDSGDWNTEEILRAKRIDEKRAKMLEKEHKMRGTVT